MPPRSPKLWPPIAKLALVSKNGSTVTVSTDGTVAGHTGQGANRVASSLSGWQMLWGDSKVDSGSGAPPSTLTHTYASTITTAFTRLLITDVNTLTNQATLTITLSPNVPSAPQSVTATATSRTTIHVAWLAASGATSYTIERSLDGLTFSLIGSVATLSFDDSTLTAGTLYYYRVQAFNASGASAYSLMASATTFVDTPPAAPSNLISVPVSSSEIDLTWTDNASNEAGYAIERQPSGGAFAQIATVGAGVTAYADTGLPATTTFTYRVRAYNVTGYSAYSPVTSAQTLGTVPDAPTGLSAHAISSSAITLTWTNVATNATSIKVQRRTGVNAFATIATLTDVTATTYPDTGLSANTTYDYRLIASNAQGDSAPSSTASATTQTLPTAPAAPTGLAAVVISASEIDLSWTDNSSNESGFQVERSTAGASGPFSLVASVGAGAVAYAVTALNQATPYWFRVNAYNGSGNSAYTSVVTATTSLAAPNPPSGLSAVATSASAVTLTWTAPVVDGTHGTPATIQIQRRVSPASFATITTVAGTVTTYGDSGLTGSTTYDYRLVAVNAAGSSAPSNTASVTTQTGATSPAAPTGLNVFVISASELDLTWIDNSTNESGFQVERALSIGGPFTLVATVGQGVITYAATGLTQNTTYFFRVRAYNAVGSSAYTNIISAQTLVAIPNAPTSLAATAVSSTQINLTWTAPVVDATHGAPTNINVQRRISPAAFATIQSISGSSVSFSDTTLAPATTYDYRLVASNAAGSSAVSNTASATTVQTSPIAPSALTATPISASRIDLGWTDNSNNESGFKIERALGSSGVFAQIGTVGTGVTSFSDTGLSQSQLYTYRVRAYNAVGNSGYTNQATATTALAPPSAPVNLTAAAISATQINLAWSNPSPDATHGPATALDIYRRIGAGSFALLTTVSGSAVSYTDTLVGIPSKALWQASDFTLLGVSYSMGNLSRAYGMTGIREAGVFKLMEWIENDHVYKYVPPAPSMSQTYNGPPSPSSPVDTGIPYGTYNGNYWQAVAPLATAELTPFALLYDDGVSPARLYWTSPSKYDVSYVAQPCIGYSTWNGSAWVPVGNWCLSTTRALGGYGNRWAHSMGLLPTWFSTNFAGGRRYWVGGSGGNFVSIVGNDVSMGPTLFAVRALTGTEPWKSLAVSADTKPLVFHPYHDSELAVVNYPTATNDGYLHPPRIARRQPGLGVHNKYMDTAQTTPDDRWLPDVSTTDGYWDWQGDSAPGSIWLETTNKFGWITFPTLIRGNYRQTISAISYVGRISGVDWWDVTVPTTTGLEPNMQVFVKDATSPHYGGFLCEVNHNANTGPYNPNLPDSLATTNPILSSTTARIWNTESTGGFEDMAGAVGNPITAGAYYGGGGGKPSAFRTFWYVYSPAALAAQALNVSGPWSELDPAVVWPFNYDRRREIYVAGSRPPIVTAAAFDDVANILYLRVYLGDLSPTGGQNRHMIYHFQVTP